MEKRRGRKRKRREWERKKQTKKEMTKRRVKARKRRKENQGEVFLFFCFFFMPVESPHKSRKLLRENLILNIFDP